MGETLSDKNYQGMASNYNNLWALLDDSEQKDKVCQAITKLLLDLMNNTLKDIKTMQQRCLEQQ